MRALFLSLVALTVPAALLAQAAEPSAAATADAEDPFVKSIAAEAVRELAATLEENFVFPDKGNAYAAMLRANLAAGKYSSFADAQAFAEAVTDDLQAVNKDGHLRVHVVPPEHRPGPQGGQQEASGRPGPPPAVNAISKSGWLADNVAYIRFEGFPGNEATLSALRTFIDEHKEAKSLIIDARTHRGGGLAEMDLLFPHLFDKPTVLVAMDTRVAVEERGGNSVERASLRKILGPEGVVRREHFVTAAAQQGALGDADVYLLTSNRTASAGEHLALSLKRTGRATLIGETTRGAGHHGGMKPLDKGFTYAAFIPVGRTFDPDTGEGWEGTGVQPDIEVPADKALDEALKRAGVSKPAEVAVSALK